MRSKGKLDECCVEKERNRKENIFLHSSRTLPNHLPLSIGRNSLRLLHGSQHNSHFVIRCLRALYLSKWGICVRGRKYSIVSDFWWLFEILTILSDFSYQFRLYGRKSFPPWWYRTIAIMNISLSLSDLAIIGRCHFTTSQTRRRWSNS